MNWCERDRRDPRPLSAQLREIAGTAQIIVLRQAASALDRALAAIPDALSCHDELIACYVLGFVNGMCQHSQADLQWAGGDEALAQQGFLACVTEALTALMGAQRMQKCQASVPQLRMRPASRDLALLERAGGEDGFALAAMQVLPGGGELLRFLRDNARPPERPALRSAQASEA